MEKGYTCNYPNFPNLLPTRKRFTTTISKISLYMYTEDFFKEGLLHFKRINDFMNFSISKF